MLLAIIIVASLLLGSIGVVWLVRRGGRRPVRASPPPPVFLPPEGTTGIEPTAPQSAAYVPPLPSIAAAHAGRAGGTPRPDGREITLERTVVIGADAPAGSRAEPGDESRDRSRDGGRAPRRSRRPSRPLAGVETAAGNGVAMVGGAAATAAATSAATAAQGTMRMLPGRLEVVDGHPGDREIRFVAEPGTADQRFTMGRGEGPPYQHIRLQGETVSRLHAALSYQHGAWAIENLSETNPLRVNGQAVDGESAGVPLSDGDLIELGEVVLRFRV